MGRVAKNKPAAEPEPSPTVTQTRTRRTPKPNPKYAEESAAGSKLDLSDAPNASEGGEKSVEAKKPGRKPGDSSGKGKGAAAAKKAPPLKKQKLDLDDEETTSSKERPETEPAAKVTGRATRSGKADESLKVGDESVAIVDVSSIIGEKKTVATAAEPAADTNRSLRGRKRAVAEDVQMEEVPKKKKESESEKDQTPRPSAITTRKSYLPAGAKKAVVAAVEVKTEDKVEPKAEPKSPIPAIVKVTRNSSGSTEIKKEPEVKVDNKKLPFVKKIIVSPQPRQVVQQVKSPINVVTRIISSQPKTIPRLLNSMISKDKQSPTIKLTGDGRDKKVFSIDLTDDSIRERKIISPVKATNIKPSPHLRNSNIGVKENVTRTPPADLLKNTLVSELSKMKASANLYKRNTVPVSAQQAFNNQQASRRITKFESWFVIDVKPIETSPFRHTHTFPLVRLGNNVNSLKLPSEKWEYKISLQRRTDPPKDGEEVFSGNINDKEIDKEKTNYEPINVLFKRTEQINNRASIVRSLMLKPNLYTITMNGKQCKLIGAPSDIKTLEDLEILLDIIDSCDIQSNKCVELVTSEDVLK